MSLGWLIMVVSCSISGHIQVADSEAVHLLRVAHCPFVQAKWDRDHSTGILVCVQRKYL